MTYVKLDVACTAAILKDTRKYCWMRETTCPIILPFSKSAILHPFSKNIFNSTYRKSATTSPTLHFYYLHLVTFIKGIHPLIYIPFSLLSGIVPLFCNDLFKGITENNEPKEFEVRFSMLEIYNEVVHDLLNPTKNKQGLKVRQHPKKGFYGTYSFVIR